MNVPRRITLALAVVLGSVLIAADTWAIALRAQSPDQREAAAAPPSAQPITVAVVRGDLTEQTTVLASAQYSQTMPLTVSQPTDGRGVITRGGVAAGDTLRSGGVVTWVNSRPLIALAGAFSLYRDLYLGDQGDDVRLVQQALANLGYALSVDGTLGARTAAAIKALYETTGAQPPQAPTQSSAAEPPSPAATPTTQPATEAPTLVLPASEVLIVPTLPVVVSFVPAVGTTVDEQATVVLHTTSGTVPDGWLDRTDVLVTLNLSEPLIDQLLVPQRAISLDVNGVASVLVTQEDGSFAQVRVAELGCVAGTCAVSSEDGALTEGMTVRVDG